MTPYFDRDGYPQFYIHRGDGQPIVFIHGYLGNSYTHWKDQLNNSNLTSQYQLIAPNIHSFDNNNGKKGRKVNKTATDIHDLRFLLKRRLSLEKQLILVGYSIGGALALAYALTYPQEILGIFLVSPLPFLNNILPPKISIPQRGKSSIIKGRFTITAWTVIKQIIKSLSWLNLRMHKSKMAQFLKNAYRLTHIPILLTYGREDTVNPTATYKALMEYLPKDNIEVIPFQGDHNFFREQPNKFNRVLLNFCRKLSE